MHSPELASNLPQEPVVPQKQVNPYKHRETDVAHSDHELQQVHTVLYTTPKKPVKTKIKHRFKDFP